MSIDGNTLPSGTVTFLFTDIEGSTLLAQQYPASWESLRERHQAILKSAMDAHRGCVFQMVGDAFCVAFHTAKDALNAAVEAQRTLQSEEWDKAPVKVRMGLHTGSAEVHGNDYQGYLTLAKVQRIMSVAYGGQVLVSNASAELLHHELPEGISLYDKREHRLRGLPGLEHLWQVVAPELQHDFPPLQSLSDNPNNLPAQLTSFVGRRKELEDVRKLLQHAPLLTLIGPGGTGKTRLSIQAAGELIPQYVDGTWFVELAPLFDPLLVPRTTAIAIGLREEPQRPVIDMLCDYLRDKRMLILLDNCEHLVDACAQMADRILRTAPHVRILASSREALGIAGEVTYRVPSLGLPDVARLPSIETLSQYEAVKLFIERAVSAVPSFTVTNNNAPFVAQICHRLDGIPLAIELAAAKLRVLNVEQIAKRLDDLFHLLRGGSRTALGHHQTLRAAIDWSYNLLPVDEQILFKRLSVFAGGWTLEAAESVCSDAEVIREDVLDLLEHLINKSMVIVDEGPHETRYRFLETIRKYAHEKLVESGQSESIRDQHLDYFLSLAETAAPHLIRPEQLEWLARIEADYENLRTALNWSMGKSSAEPALRLTGALGFYWNMRDYLTEGLKWMDQALGRAWDETSRVQKVARAKVLYSKAAIAHEVDDYGVMNTSVYSALSLCEETADLWGRAYARVSVGKYLIRTGNARNAVSPLEQALDEFRKLMDPWGQAFALYHLVRALRIARMMDGYLQNRKPLLDSVRAAGDRYLLADVLVIEYGLAFIKRGEWEQAEAAFLESDELLVETGSSRRNLNRYYLAQLYFLRGDPEKAKHEAQTAVEYCQRVGEKNTHAFVRMFLSLVDEIQGALPEALYEQHEYLDLMKEIGTPRHLAWGYALAGRLHSLVGHREAALVDLRNGIEIIKECCEEPGDLSYFFVQIGGVAIPKSPGIAVQLLSFTQCLSTNQKDPIFYQPYLDRFLGEARLQLSGSEFNSAWEMGSKLTTTEAIDRAEKILADL
ncbi:MAG: adenylate/guanylate cyclase domain-containing protein [Syntrophothermus sp.]